MTLSRDERGLADLDRILNYLLACKDDAAEMRDWNLWEWYADGIVLVQRQHVRLATKMARRRGNNTPHTEDYRVS